ncbi:flagellar basal body-associated FliL family protein [Desulfobacterium sp. N47]|uniref:Flagellar protein FliL n=1 Tax=uncultured Desulfobacterium sp. TaxID=201089 RepID=E1YHM0_9BACT|nr:unknown protein [uncultured Desulfobacterium sp.]
MDPNKTDIDDEQFAGNELDEPESNLQFNGDELDDQFSGNELDNPGSDVRFKGNELDESDSDKRLASKESDRPDSIIEGETVHVDSPESRKNTVIVDKKECYAGKKKFTVVHKISGIVILLCLLLSVVYFFILRQPEAGSPLIKATKITAKIEKQALVFEPFIVPCEGSKYYTYMLIDISFDASGKNIQTEITEKQNEIRKIIYDILLKKIEGADSIPAAVDLKNDIKSGINAVLENGKIHEVFITKYHAV